MATPRRLMIGLILVQTGALWAAVQAFSQPTPSAIQGTIRQGEVIQIRGTGFGSKSSAPPLVWEDFSDGVLTEGLTPHGIDTLTNASGLRHAFVKHTARANFGPGEGSRGFFSYDALTAPRWFVQYWVKLSSNWHWGTAPYGYPDDGLANVKFFRMVPTGTRNYSNMFYAHNGFSSSKPTIVRAVEKGPTTYLERGLPELLSAGEWHLVQVQYGENSASDRADGHVKLWIDGRLIDASDSLVTNWSSDGSWIAKRPYIIGLYDSWPPSDVGSDVYAYYGEVYVDTSWARVEIGDAPSYSLCRHREVQLPIAWTNSEITVRINQGSFSEGQLVYLYVGTENGAVNETGIPFWMGSSLGPAQPTRVRIAQE